MSSGSNFVSKFTSADGINYINIFLMLVSVIAAFILPFEVFLFSYAVLGPLHYLTEISWLEKKNYFIKSKKDIWIFVVLVVFITIGMFNPESKTNAFVTSFIFSAFVYALILLFVEKTSVKILILALTFFVSLIFNFNTYPNLPFMIFAVWLPTIVHVFIFTGSFILYGALKSKSVSGIISFVVFVLCAFAFFIYTPENFGLAVTEYGKKAYSYFRVVNTSLYSLFGYGELQREDEALYIAPKAVAIMRFIAFAYTYHYLNWFSKTTLIKWNKISKLRLTVIIILWMASIVLYSMSYKIGFFALFLLSMLHVFFEFPLNHLTFIGIGKELKNVFSKK